MANWIAAAIAAAAMLAALSARLGAIESHLVEHIDRQINHLRKVINVSAQDVINAAVATVRKGTGEVLGKISELQAQIDAGCPVEELDLSELTAAAQALDDIVADEVVVEEPVEDEDEDEDESVDEPVEDPVVVVEDQVVDEPVAN